jgi:hypothetical protein
MLRKNAGMPNPHTPVMHPLCTLPRIHRAMTVQIEKDQLWAPPSSEPILQPPAGAWFNLAFTDTKNPNLLRGIASEYGPLTPAGADAARGEPLAHWHDLVIDLRQLAGAWTRTGELASSEKQNQAEAFAMRLQHQLVTAHHLRDGEFVSYGQAGFGMVCTEMGQWWRLSAIASVYARYPFRRCRYCNSWFTMAGRRGDAGYCSPIHRNYAAQGTKIPSAVGWWGLV